MSEDKYINPLAEMINESKAFLREFKSMEPGMSKYLQYEGKVWHEKRLELLLILWREYGLRLKDPRINQ